MGPASSFPRAAQERLLREADRMETEEHDPFSAARLRRFLRQVPPHRLVVVPVDYVGPNGSVPMGSSVSDMTIEQSDPNGTIVKKTRHCENGKCSETTSQGKMPP